MVARPPHQRHHPHQGRPGRKPPPTRHRRGRPPAFDPTAYKDRNAVERCFGQLKQNRAMATRHDKLAVRYQAITHIASIGHWLKRLT
ncbi:transposase [Actinomyces succiniciruminis]|uniref:transposase n=1 Tax=Actinomyces succiniciruminis TaxID=1522002 RepID=UPI001FD3F77E|nr:transposase [Actinomyces succiniciruminis]